MSSAAFDHSDYMSGNGTPGYVEITSDNTLVDEAVRTALIPVSLLPASAQTAISTYGVGPIRVTNSAGTTAYSAHTVGNVIRWDCSDDIATGSNVTWRIYAGNSDYTEPGVTDTLGRNNVYVGDSVHAMYPLFEDPSGTTTDVRGSHNLADVGPMVAGDLVTGKVGSAVLFESSKTQYLQKLGGQLASNTLTMSAWVKLTSTGANQVLVYDGIANGATWYAHYMAFGAAAGRFQAVSAFNNIFRVATDTYVTPTIGQWHFVAMRVNGTGYRAISVDGNPWVENTDGISNSTSQFDVLRIGAGNAASAPADATIDEVRIDSVVRGINDVTTHYQMQDDPGAFWTVGAWNAAAAGGLLMRRRRAMRRAS